MFTVEGTTVTETVLPVAFALMLTSGHWAGWTGGAGVGAGGTAVAEGDAEGDGDCAYATPARPKHATTAAATGNRKRMDKADSSTGRNRDGHVPAFVATTR
jgi:hypothetical protein